MATILFGTGAITECMDKSFGTESSASSYGLMYGNSYTTHISYVRIMKGAVPTDFSALTTSDSRSSDRLIEWVSSGPTAGDRLTSLSDVDVNRFTLATKVYPAMASGLATWFWVFLKPSGNTTLTNQIAGTVGLNGSGADIEIYDTNIIAGNSYKISGVQWVIPPSVVY